MERAWEEFLVSQGFTKDIDGYVSSLKPSRASSRGKLENSIAQWKEFSDDDKKKQFPCKRCANLKPVEEFVSRFKKIRKYCASCSGQRRESENKNKKREAKRKTAQGKSDAAERSRRSRQKKRERLGDEEFKKRNAEYAAKRRRNIKEGGTSSSSSSTSAESEASASASHECYDQGKDIACQFVNTKKSSPYAVIADLKNMKGINWELDDEYACSLIK
jgi:hypothetical protein